MFVGGIGDKWYLAYIELLPIVFYINSVNLKYEAN